MARPFRGAPTLSSGGSAHGRCAAGPFAPARADRPLFSLPGSAANADEAVLQVTCRLEKSDGSASSLKTLSQSRPLKERTPEAQALTKRVAARRSGLVDKQNAAKARKAAAAGAAPSGPSPQPKAKRKPSGK
jgi:hypothetical protein